MNEETVSPARFDILALWVLPLAALLFHAVTYEGYGYFRDELYYLACGRHLAFGYVDHPPLVAVVAAAVTGLFGESLFVIRMVSAVAAAVTVLLASAIARELGGGRYAQALAGLATLLSPGLLPLFGFYSMNALDMAAWAMLWWVVARYLRTGNERLWLLFGVVAGLGLQNKISVLFLGFGVAAGLVAARRWNAFRQPWLWLGGGLAALIFLPHIAWQIANGWPTLEFMRNAMQYKNVSLSPVAYLGTQALNTLPALPVWIAGLTYLLLSRHARPFRPLGWAYVAVLAVMLATNSKAYYLSPAYSLLFAAGGVAFGRMPRGTPGTVARVLVMGLVLALGAALAPFAKALLPEDTFVAYAETLGLSAPPEERHQMGRLPQHFADMHGWRELADTVGRVHATLPAEDRPRACVFAENYGQAGAIDLFGPPLGIPRAISGHNSYFLWGPQGCTGEVLVVIGGRREKLLERFERVEQAATFTCIDCMPYENNKPIWIARRLRQAIEVAWPSVKHYS